MILFASQGFGDEIGTGDQSISKVCTKSGKIRLELRYGYDIGLTLDQAKKLIDLLNKGIDNLKL